MRNARIGRGAAVTETPGLEVAKPSPLAAFVDVLHGLAANRKMFAGFPGAVCNMTTCLEDLNMMLHERLVPGLRTPWVRRVALPVWAAHRTLDERFQQPDEAGRAKKAIEILTQCTDEEVRNTCTAWIRETYHV